MRSQFAGRRVLVTGHTGFKGSWLTLWLSQLGAKVFGYALDPATTPDLFGLARVGEVVDDMRGDVRDGDKLYARVADVRADVVFHLAAQPIVRASYDDPAGTFGTNVLGTVNLLEGVRRAGHPCAVVIVTTDKCYEDTGGVYAARETDPLGGIDPYSASKACAEIVTSSYARSFFGADRRGAPGPTNVPIRVASARAGNVIGGGDFAPDRLIPDLVRSIERKEALKLRHPHAVRPWQHVLEPLSGYLWLAACLGGEGGQAFAEPWNFGPSSEAFRTVIEIATRATAILRGRPVEIGTADPSRHEMPSLTLTTDKARRRLGWAPVWSIDHAITQTMEWYRGSFAGEDGRAAALNQIAAYTADAERHGAPWAIASKAKAKESA